MEVPLGQGAVVKVGLPGVAPGAFRKLLHQKGGDFTVEGVVVHGIPEGFDEAGKGADDQLPGLTEGVSRRRFGAQFPGAPQGSEEMGGQRVVIEASSQQCLKGKGEEPRGEFPVEKGHDRAEAEEVEEQRGVGDQFTLPFFEVPAAEQPCGGESFGEGAG